MLPHIARSAARRFPVWPLRHCGSGRQRFLDSDGGVGGSRRMTVPTRPLVVRVAVCAGSATPVALDLPKPLVTLSAIPASAALPDKVRMAVMRRVTHTTDCNSITPQDLWTVAGCQFGQPRRYVADRGALLEGAQQLLRPFQPMSQFGDVNGDSPEGSGLDDESTDPLKPAGGTGYEHKRTASTTIKNTSELRL